MRRPIVVPDTFVSLLGLLRVVSSLPRRTMALPLLDAFICGSVRRRKIAGVLDSLWLVPRGCRGGDSGSTLGPTDKREKESFPSWWRKPPRISLDVAFLFFVIKEGL